jgi:hypothetical protein
MHGRTLPSGSRAADRAHLRQPRHRAAVPAGLAGLVIGDDPEQRADDVLVQPSGVGTQLVRGVALGVALVGE